MAAVMASSLMVISTSYILFPASGALYYSVVPASESWAQGLAAPTAFFLSFHRSLRIVLKFVLANNASDKCTWFACCTSEALFHKGNSIWTFSPALIVVLSLNFKF